MQLKLVSVLCLIACCNQGAFAETMKQLEYVQILFRHGDRAPIELYPTDVNPVSSWPEGLKKLTKLGKKQHYELGKLFRKMYGNFITSSPLEVNVTSSGVDRCIKSAATNLASFYAPTPMWQFEKDFNWQPIPISYIPKYRDKYLETDSICPQASEEMKRILKSPEGQKILNENRDMFNNVSKFSGKVVTNWTYAAYLYDTLFVERKYHLVIPKWANDYWDQLENVSNLAFYISYSTPLMQRLRAGPLIGLMIEKMKKKLSGEVPNAKIQIYSSHDTNVAVFLNALNLFNMKKPPYCTSVIVELYKATDGSNQPTVRLLFLNSSTPETLAQIPHILVLNGCSEYCPLDFFINYTRHLIPDNWEAECKLKNSNNLYFGDISESGLIATLLCLVIAFAVIIVACIIFRKLQNQNRREYSYHLMPSSQS